MTAHSAYHIQKVPKSGSYAVRQLLQALVPNLLITIPNLFKFPQSRLNFLPFPWSSKCLPYKPQKVLVYITINLNQVLGF